MKFGKFISELNRRNVFKATIAYLAIAWVFIQIASTVLPAFNAPDYAIKIIIYLLLVGLIFWVGFSWIYDWTPDGLQKTDDTIDDEETSRLNNRRLNKVIVGSLTLAVLLLIVISFYAGSRWNDSPILHISKKVAIIPFEHEAEDSEEDYFKTGMTQELINELSKVDQLTVINQPSTKVLYSTIGPSNILISNELKKIDYFIYGTIKRQLNKLNIQLELKESSDAEPIWKKSYSKDISQVRQLWADVARDLAREMGIEVKQDDAILWSNLRRVKPETYELYLKGKYYLNKSTLEEVQRGFVYLQEAIDQNPADPDAHAGLAEGYITIGHSPIPSPDVFPKALVATQRAIQLDSLNAHGWAALADYHTYFGWDWQLAEYAFYKANELNPNMAWNHFHRSWYLVLFGHINEAIEEHKRAQELDPFTPPHTAFLGELYRLAGLYDEGLRQAEKASQTRDEMALGLLVKGTILVDQGKHDEGLEVLKQASSIMPWWKYWGYGPALIRSGHIQEGKAVIQELEGMEPTAMGTLCLGLMYSELGDIENTLKWFRYKNKHAWYPWLRIYVKNKKILNDPRFLELIREMNLPDPAPLIYDINS